MPLVHNTLYSRTVKFYGGPMHSRFKQVERLRPEVHVPIMTPILINDADPAEIVRLRRGKYVLIRNSWLVLSGDYIIPTFAYVWMGEI